MIYEPAEDSFLLQKYIKKYTKGKSFLDMGSGSGIQTESADRAESVLAVDIDPEVIRKLKEKNIPAVHSNLFSKVKGKFQVIAFNPPYLPQDVREDRESSRITSGGKKGDEIIVRFLKQVPSHLEKNGIILLIVSSLTPRKMIDKILKKNNMKKRVIAEHKLFMEKLELWEIRAQ